jgi:hypothetical protein
MLLFLVIVSYGATHHQMGLVHALPVTPSNPVSTLLLSICCVGSMPLAGSAIWRVHFVHRSLELMAPWLQHRHPVRTLYRNLFVIVIILVGDEYY